MSEHDVHEVEDRLRIVSRLYGDRLDEGQLAEVRKGVEGIVEMSEALRAVSLKNGEEPMSVFAPYREEE